MEQRAGRQEMIELRAAEIVSHGKAGDKRTDDEGAGQQGEAGRGIDAQDPFPEEAFPGGAVIETLGDEQAAEKEEGGQAQEADVEMREIIPVTGQDQVGVGFHDHGCGDKAEEPKVIVLVGIDDGGQRSPARPDGQ